MSRTTKIWIALIACLTCLAGFESLNITAGMMSDLAATGSLRTDKATMAQALWLDFGFILAYSALFALWLRSASEAFSALKKYYKGDQSSVGNGTTEKVKPSFFELVVNLFNRLFRLTNNHTESKANDQRTQAIAKRVELLDTFAQISQGIGIALIITAISDGIENGLALAALSRGQGFGGWAVTATWIKFGGFFVVFGYCAFTSVVRGLWRIKPTVELTFSQIASAEQKVIDEGRTRLGRSVTTINPDLAGLALSGGGIRSATFALGVLQELAASKQLNRFDYLSSVSGGGYLAGALHALKRRSGAKGLDETVAALNKPEHGPAGVAPLSWLRRYGNYLSPSMAAGSGDKVAMFAFVGRNMVLSIGQFSLLLFGLTLLAYALLAKQLQASPHALSIELGFAFALAGFANAVFVFLQQTQAKSLVERKRFSDSELDRAWSFCQIVLLSIAAILTTFALRPYVVQRDVFPNPFDIPIDYVVVGVFVGSGAIGHLFAMLFERTVESSWRSLWSKQSFASIRAAGMGGLLGAVCIGATVQGFRDAEFAGKELIWLTMGPVMLVLSALLAGSLEAALSSRNPLYELSLEYWSRVGGTWFWLMLSAWLMPIVCLFFGSYMINWLGSALAAGVAYLVSSGALLNLAFKAQSSTPSSGLPMRMLMFLAPKLILLGLLLAIASIVVALVAHLSEYTLHFCSFDCHTNSYIALAKRANPTLLGGIALASLALWAWLAWKIPMHKLTLGMMYKNRLVRAYLAASHTDRFPDHATNFDLSPTQGDDLRLAELMHRPYPLFNTALNLIRPDHSQLDWQDRKAAPFLLSPLYCGYLPPDRAQRRPVGDIHLYSGQQKHLSHELSVGDAIAISGAAANPAMGYHSQPDLAALLALCNVRLGQWVANRAAATTPIENGKLSFSGSYLLREALGDVTDETSFVHLSDGGHFDNMGLFELVRRELALIVVIDGSQDEDFAFADLSSALLKCRVDLGVNIPLDPSQLRQKALKPNHSETCLVPQDFDYPSGKKGMLIYVKAVRLPDMKSELQTYISQNDKFPHQSTGDQFFSETQFEAYRMLGLHAGELLAKKLQDM